MLETSISKCCLFVLLKKILHYKDSNHYNDDQIYSNSPYSFSSAAHRNGYDSFRTGKHNTSTEMVMAVLSTSTFYLNCLKTVSLYGYEENKNKIRKTKKKTKITTTQQRQQQQQQQQQQ
ncbi:hypothetical protein ACTFIV_008618 [Dictyostelium citrinum]